MKQVSSDNCFMRDQLGVDSAKILVSKDRATRMVSAYVVPLKGAVIDCVIQQCARDLESPIRNQRCRFTVERVH